MLFVIVKVANNLFMSGRMQTKCILIYENKSVLISMFTNFTAMLLIIILTFIIKKNKSNSIFNQTGTGND